MEEIKDENINMSEDLLNKSAQKLLRFMKTPTKSQQIANGAQFKEKEEKQLQNSPYMKAYKLSRERNLAARESKLSLSEQNDSNNKTQSRLQNMSDMFQSTKLSQLFKKPAFYS